MDPTAPPSFHPGHFPRLSRREQRERERHRRPQVKKEITPYVPSAQAANLFANVYKGPIWWTPPSLKVCQEAKHIFNSVAAQGPKDLQSRLRKKYHEPNFYTTIFFPSYGWKMPYADEVRRSRQEIYKKIWRQVWRIYRTFEKAAPVLKRFLVRWNRLRCLRNCKNTEDIVTLEAPKQPVYLVDIKNKCSYVFEAKTLRIAMEKKFTMCEFMFADPKYPTNPFTNEMLTQGQCISVIGQLFEHRQFSWALERFRAGGCNLARFERSFRQYLKMKAIMTHFQSEPEDCLETTIDYFQAQAEDAGLSDYKIAAFILFLKNNPRNTFVRDWYRITKQYYLARELNDMATLVLVAKRSRNMVTKVYYDTWM
jgi:hypothetical protein